MAAINIVLKAVDKYSGTLTGLNQGLELVGKTFNVIGSVASVAFDGISAAIGGTLTSLNSVGNEFEQIAVKMETIFGGAGPAKKAVDWAAEFGAKTPLTLQEVTSAMIKLKTFGFDPFDGTLQKVGDAAFALGTDFDGIVTALGQMQLKGKVSAEELMQLAERNVPVYDILRERFKLTADQLGDIGRQGLDVREAVTAIVDGLGARFSGAMAKASNTAKGAFSTIGDIVTVFQKDILDAGVWDTYVKQIIRVRDTLAKTLGSEEGKKFAKAIGEAITDAMRAGIKAAEDFADYVYNEFPGVAQALSDFWARPKDTALKAFYKIKVGAALLVNNIIDAFQVLNSGNIVSGFVNTIIQAISGVSLFISSAIEKTIDLVADGFEEIANLIEGFQRSSPKIAEFLGIEDFDTSGIRNIGREFQQSIGAFAGGIALESEKYLLGADKYLGDLNGKLEKLKINVADFAVPGESSIGVGINQKTLESFKLLREQINEGIKTEVTVKLEQDKRQQQQQDVPNENEVFNALVNIITNGLVNKAVGEDVPLAVSA